MHGKQKVEKKGREKKKQKIMKEKSQKLSTIIQFFLQLPMYFLALTGRQTDKMFIE